MQFRGICADALCKNKIEKNFLESEIARVEAHVEVWRRYELTGPVVWPNKRVEGPAKF